MDHAERKLQAAVSVLRMLEAHYQYLITDPFEDLGTTDAEAEAIWQAGNLDNTTILHIIRSITQAQPCPTTETDRLWNAVDRFTEAMKVKLTIKAQHGWDGWDNRQYRDMFWTRIQELIERGPSQVVDIANLAMMIWIIDATPVEEDIQDGFL